jgi:branched-chain amino acid transport system substrate-binding protein
MSGREITAGLSVSLSGRFQIQGQQALNGLLFWQSYVNTQGDISPGASGKRPVRLIWYDDLSLARCTRDNVFRLLRDDKVDILFGPYSSGLTMGVAEIAEEYEKVLWNYGGSSDEIFGHGWHYLVGIASPASDYLRSLPQCLLRNSPESHRICVFYSEKGSFGWQVARGVVESAQLAGQPVELIPIKPPLKESDSALPILYDIKPEVVVMAASFQDELARMRTRQQWPSTVHAVAAVAAGIDEFALELGALADGVIGPSQWEPEPGMHLSDITGPKSDWFVTNFQERFGRTPGYVAAGSFATGLIVTECVGRAASLDNRELRRIAAGLDCNTFYGRFRIDPETGKQVAHRMTLVRWQQNRKVVLSH